MASEKASSLGLTFVEEPEVHIALHRKLKDRHVAMIRYVSIRLYLSTVPLLQLTLVSSISGVIGTCLFFGTAASLKDGGPLGTLLAYVFMGTICFATMVFLSSPISGTCRLTSHHRSLSLK